MLDRLTGKPVHATIHFIACTGLAFGLPWSKIPLSLATALLLLNLLIAGDFKSYWQRWTTNSVLKWLLLYLFIEWCSLLWTSDFNYALHDLRVKLPLVIIPLVMVAFPFKHPKAVPALVCIFLGMLTLTSVINMGFYFQWWGNKQYADIRGLSLFGSHIRYALLVVMGIVFSVSWLVRKFPFRIIPLLLISWWLFYLYYSQVVAGYSAFLSVVVIGLLVLLSNIQNKTQRVILLICFVVPSVFFVRNVVLILQPIPHKVTLEALPEKTINGNYYTRDIQTMRWENGYPIIAQICETEIEPAWNKVSTIDYQSGRDKKGNPLKLTLWRFLASKGLPKDSLGMSQLSQQEITWIENGTASILFTQGGLKARLYSIQNQLENHDDPNGHSLLQRLFYWQAATAIISKNWVFGVGAGDVEQAFQTHYAKTNSQLQPENRKRAHNQFLTSWVTSGIFGFCAFILLWVMQWRFAWKNRAIEWLCFIGICLSSFLSEDTIETQVGLTFVAFFFGLFAANTVAPAKKAAKDGTLTQI
jgi:hypothetical protein